MRLERINYVQKNTKDIAYTYLKEEVIMGNLEPDQQLSEGKLAEQLGISRTPLREAIQVLINDGWFIRDKNRIKVAPVNYKEINDLFLIRERLEALAIFQATIKSTPEFEGKLKKLLEKMSEAEESQKLADVISSGNDFHSLIIEQSNNSHLKNILLHLLDHIRRYRHLGVYYVPSRANTAIYEHKLMLEAIEHKDEKKAEQLMKEHISSSRKSIILSDK